MRKERCVLCVAHGRWHPLGLKRLRLSLAKQGFSGDLLAWEDEFPPGSPPHADTPYAFKPYAFRFAQLQGYKAALWVDSSCWAIKPLDTLFARIEADGYLFFRGGWNTGQWCADHALEKLWITREEAFEIPHIAATCMGLRFDPLLRRDEPGDPGNKFLDAFLYHANDGSFRGPWRNDSKQASADPRVLGHRHDQTAASVIIHRHELKLTDCPEFFAYHSSTPDPRTCIVARGMRGDETEAEIEEML